MAKILHYEQEGKVVLRLDNAYCVNSKHLVEPYYDEKGKRYFGSFKFEKPEEAKSLLWQASQLLRPRENSIFYGNYPKWEEDARYGVSLRVSNFVKFYKGLTTETISPDEIADYIYSIEVHLSKTKDEGIFLLIPRAVASRKRPVTKYHDELFDDFVDLSNEDLPF